MSRNADLIPRSGDNSPEEIALYSDVRNMIAEARKRAYVAINTEAIMVNWRVGTRIRTDILKNKRAEYGKQIIAKLAFRLTEEFGRGWGVQTLQHCVRSAYTFSEEQISYAVRTQLSWTHLRSLMSVESDLARTFYLEMAAIEHWSTRELSDKIQSALYERTAISRKPEELIEAELKKVQNTGDLTPDLIFKSSYILDFLGLKDTYAEEDLEDAILDEIQNFKSPIKHCNSTNQPVELRHRSHCGQTSAFQ